MEGGVTSDLLRAARLIGELLRIAEAQPFLLSAEKRVIDRAEAFVAPLRAELHRAEIAALSPEQMAAFDAFCGVARAYFKEREERSWKVA